jgi:hypothetical protein
VVVRDAPRRATDLRIFEAVYHFNRYMYLSIFRRLRGGLVYPEFPTGNGKIDLIINYAGQKYGLEVKSYVEAIDDAIVILNSQRTMKGSKYEYHL